jgi:serine protease Do
MDTPQTSTFRTIALASATSLLVSSLVLIIGNYTSATAQQTSEQRASLPSPSTQIAVAEEQAVIDVVKQTEPAVVSVVISKDVPKMEQYFEDAPIDPFFAPFNLQIPRLRQNGTELRQIGGGTAFFVSSDGLLLTNKHVVSDERAEYTVYLNDGRELKATVAGRDPTNDVALLKVEGSNFPYLRITSEEPTLGQTVIAIGNALAEFRNTVSRGVVSGLQRSIMAGDPYGGQVEQLSRIIQTDAAINQGNSGGPLLNLHGEVLGMNTAVAAGSAQNIAFAIPAEDLARVLKSYQQYKRIVRPYIGIRYTIINDELKAKNNLAYDYGVLVSRGDGQDEPAIIPGSPADKAGIVENDVILEVDGQKLTDETSLQALVQRKMPGDKVRLKIAHQGQEKTVEVTLDEWKE